MSMVGSVATLKAVTEAAPRETGGEVSGSPLLVTGRVPRSEFERGDLRANCRPTRSWAAASGIAPEQSRAVCLQGCGEHACKIGAVKPRSRKLDQRGPQVALPPCPTCRIDPV